MRERRSAARRPLRLPQHTEHSLQILQGRPAGLLDGGQGQVGELRAVRRQSGPRLDDGDGQRVADGVVQFARDAVAFQELLGAFLQGGEPFGGGRSQQAAGEPGDQLPGADDDRGEQQDRQRRERAVPPVVAGEADVRTVPLPPAPCHVHQVDGQDGQLHREHRDAGSR
ncbi:hypothetical protein STENM36S_00038 [Streptomyces tendae]